MTAQPLVQFSHQIAEIVEAAAPSVVQVQGRRRPASGLVLPSGDIVTTTRALGQEHGIRIRTHAGDTHDATLRAWDPATGLAVLATPHAAGRPIADGAADVRTGHLLIGVARSWSHAVTATAGVVAVVGGPLPTGPGRAIDRVIRTSAPMHGGFAGSAVLDASGQFAGVGTGLAIRGFGVIIPADIVLSTTRRLIEHGTPQRGYLGIAGQPVRVGNRAGDPQRTVGLLVVAVSDDSPASAAGVMVGDVIMAFDGIDVRSPLDLLALLDQHRTGRSVPLTILRGTALTDLSIIVGIHPPTL
jgi:serine protease DegQ